MDIRAHVIALNEDRARVVSELRAELDATAGRERNQEEQTKIGRLDARIDELDAEVREFVARETRDQEAGKLREQSLALFGEARVNAADKREGDAVRLWLRDGARNDFEINLAGAIKERQLLRQGASPEEIRALAWDATSGSLVVPTTMARTLYEYLEATIAAFRIGAQTMNTSTGENIVLPRLLTHSIGSQVAGHGSTISTGDPTFGNVALNSYKYGVLTAVASELVDDGAFDLSSWLARDIGYAIGRVVDADLVVGTGTSEPKGMSVLTGAGTNAPVTTGGSLIAPTVEKFIDTVYSVNDGARDNGAAWLLRDSTAGTVRKLRDGAGGTVGAFLWQPSLTQGVIGGQPDKFLGYPVYTDPNMAAAGSNATLATFGDFSEYVVRTVGNPVIQRDESVYFATDQVAFRGKWRIGGNHTAPSHLNNLVQNV